MPVRSPRQRAVTRSFATLGILATLAILLMMSGSAQTTAPSITSVMAKCEQCHGEKLQMAHFSVATRDLILKGGDHGPAIVPGDPASSLLYQRISGQAQPVMPMAPLPRLTPDEIAAV